MSDKMDLHRATPADVDINSHCMAMKKSDDKRLQLIKQGVLHAIDYREIVDVIVMDYNEAHSPVININTHQAFTREGGN